MSNLEYENVICALCGHNETVVIHTIKPGHIYLSRVRLNGTLLEWQKNELIVTCKHCGLVYVNPRLVFRSDLQLYSLEEEIEYFRTTRDSRIFAYGKLLEQICGWVGRQPQRLLDIGCGDGVLLELACAAGIESGGTEISEHLIRLVRERLGQKAFVSSDLACLPKQTFDVITMINILEHVREPGPILSTAAALLKPGGIVVVHVPNFGGITARLRGAKWHQIAPLEHFYYFTFQTLSEMLIRYGFRPEARFNLLTGSRWKRHLQQALKKLGVYLDNGLGIVARRQ